MTGDSKQGLKNLKLQRLLGSGMLGWGRVGWVLTSIVTGAFGAALFWGLEAAPAAGDLMFAYSFCGLTSAGCVVACLLVDRRYRLREEHLRESHDLFVQRCQNEANATGIVGSRRIAIIQQKETTSFLWSLGILEVQRLATAAVVLLLILGSAHWILQSGQAKAIHKELLLNPPPQANVSEFSTCLLERLADSTRGGPINRFRTRQSPGEAEMEARTAPLISGSRNPSGLACANSQGAPCGGASVPEDSTSLPSGESRALEEGPASQDRGVGFGLQLPSAGVVASVVTDAQDCFKLHRLTLDDVTGFRPGVSFVLYFILALVIAVGLGVGSGLALQRSRRTLEDELQFLDDGGTRGERQ